MSVSQNPKGYDKLPCDCGKEVAPKSVTAKGVVKYECPKCENTWRIDADGDLIE